jgi:predicted glycosyltransferase
MPSGVDCLVVPAFHKERDGAYSARDLALPLDDLVKLRSQVIRCAIETFEPDVLIVDYSPRGGLQELDLTLKSLRAESKPRCVLGLRDVLSDPAYLQSDWGRTESIGAILEYYDEVWIYGDPAVYDAVCEYQFPSGLGAKVRYTGYLDQRLRLQLLQDPNQESFAALSLPPGRLALCLVGGGQDGKLLAEAFLNVQLPPGMNGVVLTGPFMPFEARQRLLEQAAGKPRFRVIDFLPEPGLLLEKADCVVAMGGYNTVCEVLSFQKPALIVPRANSRREQITRAERLCDLGIIDVLMPDRLDSHALTEWIARDKVGLQLNGHVDMNGLSRAVQFLRELVTGPASRGKPRRARGILSVSH